MNVSCRYFHEKRGLHLIHPTSMDWQESGSTAIPNIPAAWLGASSLASWRHQKAQESSKWLGKWTAFFTEQGEHQWGEGGAIYSDVFQLRYAMPIRHTEQRLQPRPQDICKNWFLGGIYKKRGNSQPPPTLEIVRLGNPVTIILQFSFGLCFGLG